jgi:predicted double-glycine peptidase
MNPWLETLGALLFAAIGALLGKWFSQLSGRRWIWGYAIASLPLLVIGFSRRIYSLLFIPPFSWLLAGRLPFAIAGFAIALLISVLLHRCPRKRERACLWALLFTSVGAFSTSVFLGPALDYRLLRSLQTTIDADGVCRQNTGFTCGPAASVTALRQFGIAAEESELSILAHTSSYTGTPPAILARTLQKKYRDQSLIVEFQTFDSIQQLRKPGVTIALVKFGFLVDHYVTVLSVSDDKIVVGDPYLGLTEMTHPEFLNIWRFAGVHLQRSYDPSASLEKNSVFAHFHLK